MAIFGLSLFVPDLPSTYMIMGTYLWKGLWSLLCRALVGATSYIVGL